jgi:hypothetical protein
MSSEGPTYANAEPTKRLFLSLLTRDISLEHAVLDLIDNSINSAIRTRGLDLIESFDEFISGNLNGGRAPAKISIQFAPDLFEIEDDCGGIPLHEAENNVFRFGRDVTPTEGDVLSVYGVGLKRALFKIGDHIKVWSQDSENAFLVEDHAAEWAARAETEWKFPLTRLGRDASRSNGTKIVLRDILPDIRDSFSSSSFEQNLIDRISGTYAFFIGAICEITVNGREVPALPLKIGSWEGKSPQIDRLSGHGCEVRIIAGLSPRELWEYEKAGWYLFCNGRTVILAEKSPLTGWGDGMPLYMSKFRGFRGLVFFFAKNPENLPWTTTKTYINQESPVYKMTLTSMSVCARPVLNFLNSLYQQDEVEQSKARAATNALVEKSVTEFLPIKEAAFSVQRVSGPRTVSIQYNVTADELNRIKKHRGKSTESARKIGRMTFDYYLKHEGI